MMLQDFFCKLLQVFAIFLFYFIAVFILFYFTHADGFIVECMVSCLSQGLKSLSTITFVRYTCISKAMACLPARTNYCSFAAFCF